MTITDPAVAPSADRLAAARLTWSANATRTIVAESRTKEQTKAIRNWARARANGHDLSDRGRMPTHIIEECEKATPRLRPPSERPRTSKLLQPRLRGTTVSPPTGSSPTRAADPCPDGELPGVIDSP